MGFENESVGGLAPESEVGFETDDIDLDNGAMPAARAVKAKRSPRDHMEPRQGGIKRDRLGRRSYDENGDEDLGEGAELIAPSRPVRVSGSGMSGMRTNRLMSENSEFGYLFSDAEPEDRHMSASRSSRLDALAYDEKQDGEGSQYDSLFSETESMVRRKENRRPASDTPIGVRETVPKPAEPTPSEPIAMPRAPRKAEKKPEPAPAPAPAPAAEPKNEEKRGRFSLRGRKDKDAKNAPGRQPELPPEPLFGDRDFDRDRRYDDRRFDDRRYDDRRYDERRRFDDRRFDDRRYDDRRYDDRRGAYPPPGYPYPPAYPQYPYPPQYPTYPPYPAYQQYPPYTQQVLYPQGVDANGQVIYSTVPGAMPGTPVIVYQPGLVPGAEGVQMPAVAPVVPAAPAAAPAAEPELIEEEIVPPAAPPLVAAPPAQPVQPAPAAPKEEPIGEDIFGDGPLPTPPSPPPARRSQPSEGGSRFNRRGSQPQSAQPAQDEPKPAEKPAEAPAVTDPTPSPAAAASEGGKRFNRRGATAAPAKTEETAPAAEPAAPAAEPAPAPTASSGGSRFNRRK